LQAEANWLLTV